MIMSDKYLELLSELVSQIVALFLFAFLYKWCWNEIMPYLFGLPTITYWQMVGLSILAQVFFGKIIKKK